MKHIKNFLCSSVLCLLAICLFSCASTRNDTTFPFCINEICSNNGSHYEVAGSTPDYIELHNLTEWPVRLDGYYLSDDEDHLKKFSLDGYMIPANGYLILLADNKELPFKLSALIESLYLSDSDGIIIQHVSLPELEKDSTFSLQEDGTWHISEPTPMEENLPGEPHIKVYVAAPRFSHTAGFYDEPFDLTLEGYRTYKLYYTTDGSIPDENSIPYIEPIHIEDATAQPNKLSVRTDITINSATPPSEFVKKATIIRAIAIDQDGNRSIVVSNTYFVGFQNYDNYKNVPVLSIITDPYDLFDERDGIYVLGKTFQEWVTDDERDKSLDTYLIPTNYRMHGKEWEIPVLIQWFDEKNSLGLSQNAGLRIHGERTRENEKKSFNIYARERYGKSSFEFDFIPGSTEKDKLVVRANLGVDSIIHALLAETGIQTSPYTPCLTFLNGEFWGLYEIREKLDEKDIASFYGLSSTDIIIIKNNELEYGTEVEETVASEARAVYTELISFLSEFDLSDPETTYEEVFSKIDSVIDIDNYITYMAALTYLKDADYRNDFTMWKTTYIGDNKYEDGRWRWIFQDLDNSCRASESTTDIISLLPADILFSTLWIIPEFRTEFLTRTMDFANIILPPEYVEEFITPILTYYDPYLYETNLRFSNNETSKKPGTKQISELMNFFNNRRDVLISQFRTSFGLIEGTGTITFRDIPQGMDLTINGHQAHIYGDSWEGVYFKGCEITFVAGEIPGYSFSGWYENDELLHKGRTLVLSTDLDHTVIPVYEELPVIVIMNETEMINSTGRYGFSKNLNDSAEQCLLQIDETITIKRKYIDSSLTLILDDSIDSPQGFSITLPLQDYESAGVILSMAWQATSQPKWHIFCGDSKDSSKEIPFECRDLADGLYRLSFTIPNEQVKKQYAYIRLEVESDNNPISVTLNGFRIYGIPVDPALAHVNEYVRMLDSINAEEQYYPDMDQLRKMSSSEIESVIKSLRTSLQTALKTKALSTVGALGFSSPAFENLQDYPAITIDEKLIAAFYDKDTIDFDLPTETVLFTYKATDDNLQLITKLTTDQNNLSLSKNAGTFIFLEEPVEDIRFRISLEPVQFSDDLLEAFSYMVPNNALWMNVDTFTNYQESNSVALPDDWSSSNVIIYHKLDNSLLYAGEKTIKDGSILITPSEGQYLLSDEPLESFEQQAEFNQREVNDAIRIQYENKKRWIELKQILIIVGIITLGMIVLGGAIILIVKGKKKKHSPKVQNKAE